MLYNLNDKLLLVGAGKIAYEYARILDYMGVDYDVLGRGETSAGAFQEKTGKRVFLEGIEKYLLNNELPRNAIVTVNVDQLALVTQNLVNSGIKNILVEKPAGINQEQIRDVAVNAEKHKSNVFVGYNRRFYSSVLKAQEIIEKDGGILSFNFEFTEWSHVIEKLDILGAIKNNWFYANSTHVIDLAFYLGGKPVELSSFTARGVNWHPTASVFAGAGRTEKNILFSYSANWEAPGRWSLEFLTSEHRLFFRPMEILQVQKKGILEIEPVELDDHFDKKFKPGFFLQTKAFIENKHQDLLRIDAHLNNSYFFQEILNPQKQNSR